MIVYPQLSSTIWENAMGSGPWRPLNIRWYHYGAGGRYREYNLRIDAVRYFLVDDGISFHFPNPEHFAQGGWIVNPAKSGYPEREVDHAKWTGAEPVRNRPFPEYDFDHSSVCFVDRYVYFPPREVTVSQFNSGNPVELFTISHPDYPQTGGSISASVYLVGHGSSADINIKVSWDFPGDDYNEPIHRHYNVGSWVWGNRVPIHVRPSDTLRKLAEAEMLHKLSTFCRDIREGIAGDRFSLVDESCVSNDALKQLASASSGGVNLIENLADAMGVLTSIRSGRAKSAVKRWKRLRRRNVRTKVRNGFSELHDEWSRVLFRDVQHYSRTSSRDSTLKSMLQAGDITEEQAKAMRKILNKDGSLKSVVIKEIDAKVRSAPDADRVIQSLQDVSFGALSHMSSTWLAYRYMYLTTQMDVEAVCGGSYAEAVEKAVQNNIDWQHCHATTTSKLVVTGSGQELYSGKHEFSTWARPYITNAIQQSVIDNYSMGLLTLANAWDVVPFSFVADWFLGIGDFLANLDAKIALDAAHYEFGASIDSYSFSTEDMHAYIRIPSTGNRSISLDAQSSYSPSTKTRLRRVNDSVALLVSTIRRY